MGRVEKRKARHSRNGSIIRANTFSTQGFSWCPFVSFVDRFTAMSNLTLSYIILQNLKRKPYRTAAVALFVMIATGSLFAATILLRGVQNSLEVGVARMGADVIVVPRGQAVSAQEAFIVGQPTAFYMDERVQAEIAALPGVARASPQVFVQTLSNARCCVGEFFLVSFDPRTDFTIRPWLTAHLGRDLRADEIIVGDRILLRPGETALFYGSPFKVVGVLEPTGMGIDRTVFVPIEGLRQMIATSPARAEQPLTIAPTQISTVLVKVQPGANPRDVAEAIENRMSGAQALTTSQMIAAVGKQMTSLLAVIFAAIAALWLMSLLAIGLVFTLVVVERQRELGLLRAMGARRGFVFRLMLGEAALLTGAGGAVGVIVSAILVLSFQGLLEQRLKIPFLLPSPLDLFGLIALLIALALLSGALACFQPAFRISRMEPYAAIRLGE